MPRTILITGASGNIGAKLSRHLHEQGRCGLRLFDRCAAENVLAADFAEYDPGWSQAFEDIDTVIHLAGEPRPNARWVDVHRNNIVATQNVLRASQAGKVRRVVLASTNQVMGGYRFLEGPVTTDMPPAPLNPYAVSKLFCEELGRGFAAETGISVVAFRIGNILPGENVPGSHMKIGTWGQMMWLSNRDMLQAMECAIEADEIDFALLNLVSDNSGMRWDIGETRRLLGYQPQDGHAVIVSEAVAAEDALARKAVIIPGMWLDQFGNSITG
jgi:UDP-glucose 4-epimerase